MEYTDGRGTGFRIVSDRTFFDDDLAEDSMRFNPASCVVTFDDPPYYLEDAEILEIAERIRAYQIEATEEENSERRGQTDGRGS